MAGQGDQGRAQLVEEIVYLIRQSMHVQMARVDAYLDAVVLAAEQVQDTRIRLLETPPEVTGWRFAGEILLTFVLESNVGGKILATIAKRIFTPVLKQSAVFMRLPSSPAGAALKQQVRRLARQRAPSGTIAGVMRSGLPGLPGLNALGRENVKLYHDSLEALIHGNENAQTNLAAVAKACATGPRGSHQHQLRSSLRATVQA